MQINFFHKIIFLFISIVLLSPMLHAKVEVLCLGEGECITLEENNAVHPGSLSGASTDQKLGYLEWYQDQFNSSIVINESIINDIEAKCINAPKPMQLFGGN